MNEAMEMLKQLIEKVGMTGEQAWPFVVRHVWADALMGVVLGGTCFVLSLLSGALSIKYLKKAASSAHDTWTDTQALSIVLPILFGVASFIVGCVCVFNNGADLIEPTGATIRAIVGR